jgi:hypothetical protein
MPGYIITFLNTTTCSHTGQAKPLPPAGRVTILASGVITLSHVYSVMGCQNPTITSGAPPCATAQFLAGAVRVKTNGIPLAILPPPSPVMCQPTNQPMIVAPAQTRVQAT